MSISAIKAQDYNPDILNTLANLSSDEVFTPPEVANQVLDLLPQELFSSPDTTFLDPATKSGVFLREIARRLMEGLQDVFPDEQERRDHIFHHQLFGIAITELTSLMSRRSLYCSKFPNGRYSVSRFDNIEGNIRFKQNEHRFVNGRCAYCGASESQFGKSVRKGLEFHAYEFIHTLKPEEIFGMKFDVIIGNPPYQLDTEGAGRQARPIYQVFVNQAKKLSPKYISFIIPSRWFSGGMGLSEFRKEMLHDKRIEKMVDFSMSTDCFPGVDIAGGVCYFLWNSQYSGDCTYTHIDSGIAVTEDRKLNEYEVFIRNNGAVNIVRKIRQYNEADVGSIMSSLGPFGLSTSERGYENNPGSSYRLFSSKGFSFIKRDQVTKGSEYINKWKVIIGKATSAGAATANKEGFRKVIATLAILQPYEVCTFSYFVGGAFDTEREARNCQSYYATKFVRFLLLQCLTSIDITKEKFQFVPLQNFTKPWTDLELYTKYGLTEEEITFIESMISPMDTEGGENNG